MEEHRSNFSRLLSVLPAILLLTFANVLIGFSVAGVVLLQLLSNNVNRYAAFFVAIIVAIAVHAYIAFNHKLRNYITNQTKGNSNNEQ